MDKLNLYSNCWYIALRPQILFKIRPQYGCLVHTPMYFRSSRHKVKKDKGKNRPVVSTHSKNIFQQLEEEQFKKTGKRYDHSDEMQYYEKMRESGNE